MVCTEAYELAADLGAKVVLNNLALSEDVAWSRVEERNHDLQGSF